jgi:hypothetical protein
MSMTFVVIDWEHSSMSADPELSDSSGLLRTGMLRWPTNGNVKECFYDSRKAVESVGISSQIWSASFSISRVSFLLVNECICSNATRSTYGSWYLAVGRYVQSIFTLFPVYLKWLKNAQNLSPLLVLCKWNVRNVWKLWLACISCQIAGVRILPTRLGSFI